MPLERCSEAACFGCGACVAVCPKQAIALVPGVGGFRFPRVDAARCVGCGLCDGVCPIARAGELTRSPRRALAAWGADAVRAESSSGGAFTALAGVVLARGGAVCGAELRLGERRVCHACVETKGALARLRGSKYVQSETENALRDCLGILRQGRPVLFVGTPCQVAGYRFLTASFGSLALACDLVCGGVPSPGVFARYLQEEERRAGAALVGYDFRDKRDGWNFPSVRLDFANGVSLRRPLNCDPFYAAFTAKLSCRLSCASCPFACGVRVGDVTVADCWRVAAYDPALDDNGGTSLLLPQTSAGEALIRAAEGEGMLRVADYDVAHACRSNVPLRKARPASPARARYLRRVLEGGLPPRRALRGLLPRGWRVKAWCVRRVKRLGWAYLRRRQ